MRLPRSSTDWQNKFMQFLDRTYSGTSRGGTAACPCRKCLCMSHRTRAVLQIHVLSTGFAESFIMEGEGSADVVFHNEDAGPSDVQVHNDYPAAADVQVQNDDEGAPHDSGVDNEEGGAPSEDDEASNLIKSLIRGEIRGEIIDENEPNEEAKIFFKLLQEAKKELYPGCEDGTKISFIVELFQVKCMYGISNKALEGVLFLISKILPKGHCVPNTMEKVQSVVRDLGLDYIKIDACENHCVLFWKEYKKLDICPKCKASRWKTDDHGDGHVDDGHDTKRRRVPNKILRYFPLTPRLRRLYMSERTSSEMRWHEEGRIDDGKLRHPADSKAWKHVDNTFPRFIEARNVRLGLASDGFNPFGMQNVTYSCWPVILIPYNLPPWLYEKQSYWIMSMLIPGKKTPGMNIDVYLRPLIDELKELWNTGVNCRDVKAKENFTLRAMLLWTINDFPAYAMLSGWSTKGKFACPYCHKDTDYLWLKHGKKFCYMGHRRFLPLDHPWRMNKMSFNNEEETREAPVPLSGQDVLDQYATFHQMGFGKDISKKRKRDEDARWHNWRKKSIFFLSSPTGLLCS